MEKVSIKKFLWGIGAAVSTAIGVLGYYPLIPAVYGAYCNSATGTALFYIGLLIGMRYFLPLQAVFKYLIVIMVSYFGIRLYGWVNKSCSSIVAAIICAVSATVMNLSVSIFGQADAESIVLAFAEGALVLAFTFMISRASSYAESFRIDIREDSNGLLPDREEAFASAAESLSGIIAKANDLCADRQLYQPDKIQMEITGRLCAGCDGCAVCWTQESAMTDSIKKLADAVKMRMSQEKIVNERYVSNCPHYEKMVEAATEAFSRMELNEAWYRRLKENRRVIANQLDAMAKLMDDWINAENCIDTKRKLRLAKIKVCMKDAGFEAENVHIYETAQKRVCIKADVFTRHEGGIAAKKLVNAVAVAMGMKLRMAQGMRLIITEEVDTVVLYEENKLYALSGIATKKKTGSVVSGDSCGMFILDDGTYNVCISDGMGSGKHAQAESGLVVDLLEKLLEAGFRRETAISMMNSAMVITGDDESFSTVDFASIDLYTGDIEITKIGAAVSFIKRDKDVIMLDAFSLPAGVEISQESECIKNKLQNGDFLVMVTDGVLEYLHVADQKEKLREIISDTASENAGVVSQEILDRVLLNTGGYAMDDMTVITIGIWDK